MGLFSGDLVIGGAGGGRGAYHQNGLSCFLKRLRQYLEVIDVILLDCRSNDK